MRFTNLLLPVYLIGVAAPATHAMAQAVRIEAESGELDGFSILEAGFFSGGAATNAQVVNPTATYTFTAWDGPYDIVVAYCDEDDGTSSYALTGSSSGLIASWLGDQPTGTNNCSTTSLLTREIATSVTLEQGETITLACQRDGAEPCRVDYFDFTYVGAMPPVGDGAFPGAMGFGAGASGARGLSAEVCLVTNLADDGPGSFRACAEQASPAYITFAVSGYIDLSDEISITGNKTVECASAPGDGVVFRRASLDVVGDNVIVRGCRTWAGKESGGEPLQFRDGIFVGGANALVRNVMVANNSMMLATDENAGTWYQVDRVTFQHNLLAWATRWKDEGGQNHGGFGLLIGKDVATVTAVENYLVFNRGRNPLVGPEPQDGPLNTPVEFVNNLVYCTAKTHGTATRVRSSSAVHVVGNRFKLCPGAVEPADEIVLVDGTAAYVADNTNSSGLPATVDTDTSSEVSPTPLFTSSLTPAASSEVEERVLGRVGPARLISFEVDAFDHYVNGTGAIIVSVDDLGGWPTVESGTNPPDSDGDGMPDWWETTHCDGSCGPTGDHDGDGYENIEEWFHSFYLPRAPVSLDVDASALGSDGNRVFEPGEQVEVAPSWRNDVMPAVSLDGIASDFSGPSGATYTVVAEDASYGTIEPGETASCEATGICYQMGLSNPAVRPRRHWDATFDESLSEGSMQTWMLHIGESFSDMPRTSGFYGEVETALHRGVMGACDDGMFCPTRHIRRGAVPLFLLRAKEGSGYRPPACIAGEELFGDVPASRWYCGWVEELARREVVSGCGGGNYCPSGEVSRAEIAVFLLKTLEGASYTPPPCNGIFTDVACPSTFADWVEEVYNRGIVRYCNSELLKYCPGAAVQRRQIARFVTRTFGLTLYGP